MGDLRERVKAAAKGTPKPRAKKVWQQPDLKTDFANGTVLVFDQTYSHTGWCYFTLLDGALTVHAHGTLNEPTPEGLTSHDAVVQRSIWMNQRIAWVVRDHYVVGAGTFIVCERPVVAGKRTESSLLACLGVWQAVLDHTALARPDIVSNDHMKAVLCPTGKGYEKRHIREALEALGLEVGHGWNQHNRDALALGLTHLYDLRRAA